MDHALPGIAPPRCLWPRCTLRAAERHDADTLSAIAWRAKAALGYDDATLRGWREGLTVRCDTPGSTWLAEDETGIAGVVAWMAHARGRELEHLWVEPARQRQGFGRALLALAVEQALIDGVPALHIDSEPSAAGFYRRAGARPAGDVAAPIAGQPARARPQFNLDLERPRYARLEIERRWWVPSTSALLVSGDTPRRLVDRYLAGTGLRLRTVQQPGGRVQVKLGRKYAALAGLLRPVTNLYLGDAEAEPLRALPASVVRKQRHAVAGGSLDVFEQPQQAAVFEVEFGSVTQALAFAPPPWVGDEIAPAA